MCRRFEAGIHVEGVCSRNFGGRVEVEVEFAQFSGGCCWEIKGQESGDVSGFAILEDLAMTCVEMYCSSRNIVLGTNGLPDDAWLTEGRAGIG